MTCAVITGFSSGMAALVSQAYGAENFARCGNILLKQLGVHVAVLVLITILWLNAENVLLLCKQPPEVARLTGLFLRWRLASLPFFALRLDLSTFLASQRIMFRYCNQSLNVRASSKLASGNLLPQISRDV